MHDFRRTIRVLRFTGIGLLLLSFSICHAENQESAQGKQPENLHTISGLTGFQEPPMCMRPKVRAQMGDTPSDSEAILNELAQSGFGTVETRENFIDPQEGRQTLTRILEAADHIGISVDLAPGGGMPYASPGISEADSMQQLVPASIIVNGSNIFTDEPPFPSRLAVSPTLAFVAATAARVTGSSGTTTLLDPDSAVDLTSLIDDAGLLHWQVPEGRWALFGFWERATGQIPGGNPPFEDPEVWSARIPEEQPGRYFIADIFSEEGIRSALEYLKGNYLVDGNLDLIQGTEFAHDSLEVQAEMFWTFAFPEEFLTRRGYSVIKYLPVLHTPREASFNPLDPQWGGPFPPRAFDFTGDIGRRVRYDYHRTLTDLYVDRYLKTFTGWLNSHGMRSRVQVAYNYIALNMTRSGVAVDIPENESFDAGWGMPYDHTLPAYGTDRWRHVIDAYRLTGSAAHLGEGKRATLEFGNDFAAFRKQPVDYAQQLNEGFAGGITMGLLTGFGGITDNPWEKQSSLHMIGYGDSWTSSWPQWRDWPALARYFARSTVVLECGKPSVDVVIYHDEGLSTVHDRTSPIFAGSTLERAGYTYDFIDPVSLMSPKANEVPGYLFGAGPSYKVLVINNESSMPADAAESILDQAKKGLAVVMVGEPPKTTTGLKDLATRDSVVAHAMSQLLTLPGTAHVASEEEVAGALLGLGRRPAASFGEDSPLLSVHRKSDDIDVWWVFNPTDSDITTTGSFCTGGVPYYLNLWEGTKRRAAQWAMAGDRMQVPVTLPAHGTTALLFRRSEAPSLHITETSADVALYDEGRLAVRDTRGGRQTVTLSSGRTLTLDLGSIPSPVEINGWRLDVEEICPDGSTTHHLDLATLKDWRLIPELKDAVGSATYTALVSVPSSWLASDRDVLLDVGAVAGAMQVYVNGKLVTPQTIPGGRWSVNKLLQPRENEISVRLDTTLLNRMVLLKSTGDPKYQTGPTPLVTFPSGLLGPVRLIPGGRVVVGKAN